MVKGVFKILIAVPLIIVVVSILTEFINMSITSQQLKKDIKISLNSAGQSFIQESMRSKELDNIIDTNGNVYISGNIYGGTITSSTTESEAYKYFYSRDGYDMYYKWLTGNTIKNSSQSFNEIYKEMRLVDIGLKLQKGESVTASITDQKLGLAKINDLYTPINSGIPYIGTVDNSDRAYKALTNLFHWNLTQMLAQYNKDNIMEDEEGTICVNYNSWRVYVKQAKIDSIEYFVFDTQDANSRMELYDMISVGKSQYVNTTGDNRYITVAKVGYSIDVGYVGITPFGRIYNYINGGSMYNYSKSTVKSSDTNEYVYIYNIY